MSSANKRKDDLLGMPHGTAANRLRKLLLFKYVQLAGHDSCYRCSKKIENVADFSIEHTLSWQLAVDPAAAFFDLVDIAFSHLNCNVQAADKTHSGDFGRSKTHCSRGHLFDEKNTLMVKNGRHRQCRQCQTDNMRGYRKNDPVYGR